MEMYNRARYINRTMEETRWNQTECCEDLRNVQSHETDTRSDEDHVESIHAIGDHEDNVHEQSHEKGIRTTQWNNGALATTNRISALNTRAKDQQKQRYEINKHVHMDLHTYNYFSICKFKKGCNLDTLIRNVK